MKQRNITFLLSMLLSLVGIEALAYDIAVKNSDGVTIYYIYRNNKTELAVSYRRSSPNLYSNEYTGNVVIPKSVTYNGTTYPVTSIGNSAFQRCSSLTSVTIPNSVTSIGNSAFYGCSDLTSITIPNSVTSIGTNAFYGTAWYNNQPDGLVYVGKIAYSYKGTMPNNTSIYIKEGTVSISARAFEDCSGLTSVTIPNSVTEKGEYPFKGCTNLTSVTIHCDEIYGYWFDRMTSIKEVVIGNEVKSIGEEAFYNCSGITSLTIGNNVTSIGKKAFSGCRGLTSVNIPSSVTAIGAEAFNGCSNITQYIIPDNITDIGSDAFKDCQDVLYVNRGTESLLALWYARYIPYQIGTKNKLNPPFLTIISTTQTTATVKLENIYDEYNYFDGYNSVSLYELYEFDIKGLLPQYSSYIPIYVFMKSVNEIDFRQVYYKIMGNYTTKSISPTITASSTASSLSIDCSYIYGDAIVTKESVKLDGKTVNGTNISLTGLDPNHSYQVEYTIRVIYGKNNKYSQDYTTKETIKTDALKLVTGQPKVISPGNVIVSAEANVDDEEVNVGFEWRRTDWTNDFASNTGGAYMYDGTMEGYIRNLNTEKLWKYRAYYLSDSGTYYYSDWVGLDPTNTSYFEPTVHTYAKISVNGNTALVKGYALRGTDGVKVQGFKYWKRAAGARSGVAAVIVPDNAMTVETTGQVMTANLQNLEYQTDYCYVAFVTTTEGETFYGEQQSFITGKLGDINGDRTVDIVDLTLLVNHLLGGEDPADFNAAAADIDGIEGVDANDLNALINIVLKN